MGLETICRCRGVAGLGEGRLLLESDELIFRGRVRVRIALNDITKVSVVEGELVIAYSAGTMRFKLGAEAARWADRIKAPPKSRLDKMGIRAGQRVSVVGVSDRAFVAEVQATGATVGKGRLLERSDQIVFEVESPVDLDRFGSLKSKLVPAGGLWVIHRKGKDGIKDTDIFAAGKRAGLVANKVAKFSETHTAERLVIPKDAR